MLLLPGCLLIKNCHLAATAAPSCLPTAVVNHLNVYVDLISPSSANGSCPHRYSIIILVVEFIGVTAVIPYALINCIHTHPAGSPGLPIDDGMTQPDKT